MSVAPQEMSVDEGIEDAGRPDAEVDTGIDPCIGAERPIDCTCEADAQCMSPGVCRDNTCVDCTGDEGCPCGDDQNCTEGLTCDSESLCQPCGGEALLCCSSDGELNCAEGFKCAESGLCEDCRGEEGCPCADEQRCDEGLYCTAEESCEPCGVEGLTCCPEGEHDFLSLSYRSF